MSTSTEIPIDPTLIESPSTSTPSKVAGTKRKTRTSGNNAVTSSSSPSTSRVTRRSAAQVGAAVGNSTEPSRGEEENLNGYWGAANTKRARRSSPTKRSKPSTPSGPSHSPGDHNNARVGNSSAPMGPRLDPGDAGTLSLAGIEELAAAATAANSKASGIFPYIPMYPVGLTPFRYPCLKPAEPNPPPGDPNNPNFRPYNPYAPNTVSAEDVAPSENPQPGTQDGQPQNQVIDPLLVDSTGHSQSQQHPQPQPQSGPQEQRQPSQEQYGQYQQEQQQRQSQSGRQETQQQYQSQPQVSENNQILDENIAASADAAYESISALLSASQGVYPTLDSIDFGQEQGDIQGDHQG